MRESSLEAYGQVRASGKAGTQEQDILAFLTGRQAMSRRQIAHALKLETGTCAARVNALVKRGALVESENRYPCPITGVRVHLLEVPSVQLRLV